MRRGGFEWGDGALVVVQTHGHVIEWDFLDGLVKLKIERFTACVDEEI